MCDRESEKVAERERFSRVRTLQRQTVERVDFSRDSAGERKNKQESAARVRACLLQMADKESSAPGTNVQVAVRCRPLNAR